MSHQPAAQQKGAVTSGGIATAVDVAPLADCSQVSCVDLEGLASARAKAGRIFGCAPDDVIHHSGRSGEESANTLDLHALYAALCFERVVEHAQKWGSR